MSTNNDTAGAAQNSSGISLGSFVASLAVSLVTFGVEFALFLLINGSFDRIYQPRTFLVPENQRVDPHPTGLWQWIIPIFKTDRGDFIQKCGLDAYFFLRFLQLLLKIFIPLALVILPVLLPLNAIGGRGPHFTSQKPFNKARNGTYLDVTGLDRLAWGNVSPAHNNRYWAHLILAIGVIVWSCFVFFDELKFYIRIRQTHLTSPQHRLRASATTVLVTAIPTRWCTFEALDGLYDVFPGGIRNIWINRNFDNLNDKIKQRNKLSRALESAETNLIRNAVKAQAKKAKAEKKKHGHGKNNVKNVSSDDSHQARSQDLAAEKRDTDRKPKWAMYLKQKDRDTMRLPIFGWQWMISLPLIGKKVDTIDYCRKEVARLNLEIENEQGEPEKFPLMNSAFIQFNHQVAAHMACQSVSHHLPNQMAPRIVEISPDDVIWDNMSIKWWESYIRTGVVIVAFVGLIIGWAIPVSFTGLLSNIDYIAKHYHWLAWLEKFPPTAISIIQGILPQALLGLLLYLLPMIMRFLAKLGGAHTGMAVELTVQNYYFAFSFVQIFLVVSISSGITVIIPQLINKPQSTPSLLAANLPKASNYFFSYMLLQALSVSAGALVQVMGLITWFVLAPLLDSTARDKWRRQTTLPAIQWGTFFPVYSNLASIGLIYSIISPLMLVFNIISFSLFWVVYRYNTLYVTKFRFDTGGLLFPNAINQLFTGLYFMELCLIGLFFLVKDVNEDGQPTGAPCQAQGAIMIVFLALTILYQWLLNKAFSPLFRYLPITLEDEAVSRDEAFAKAQEKRWALANDEQEEDERARDGSPSTQPTMGDGEVKSRSSSRERRAATLGISQGDGTDSRSMSEHGGVETIEMNEYKDHKYHKDHKDRSRLDPRNLAKMPEAFGNLVPIKKSWADRSRNKQPYSPGQPRLLASPRHHHHPHVPELGDIEARLTGTDAIGAALFADMNDEIEDLTPEDRNELIQRAFLHEALRARRPVIWVPKDDLGVSDDEVAQTQKLSEQISITHEHAALDAKGRVVYNSNPPDFSEEDLMEK